MSESSADTFRWQSFFQHAAQPIFLLNRRRRILFVNRAWEACTGLTLAEVRGRACRRRAATASLEKDEAILNTCAPPADAVKGQACQVRRRAVGSANWWAIQFSPLDGANELLGILGTIRVLAAPTDPPFTLPEKLMALRDRQARRYWLDDLGVDSPAAGSSARASPAGGANARADHAGRGSRRRQAMACPGDPSGQRPPRPLFHLP